MFSPIAIVGRACVLPGALSPSELWTRVSAGEDLTSSVPTGRWGMRRESVLGTPDDSEDRTWSDRGGYVEGFEFDPTGFALPPEELTPLDPLFHWVLQCGRQAMTATVDPSRTGAVLGNLSFPSVGLSRFAEGVWTGQTKGLDARNRYMSGLPAHMLANALGLGGGAFALDAACASALYAIKYACDRLHDGTADAMLAGAVNRADDLFIHVGFCALSALSKTGQSRPFHAEADGLVPAEGAGMLLLKRLEDAERDGDEIFGVIRGIGLSNDGRGRGFLAPSSAGQVRAMRAAWETAGLSPTDVDLVECHATGTPVGDGTEIDSMAEVFGENQDLPVGSLKSNMGHLITAAGVAGILKVLGGFENGLKPPTLHADVPNPALDGTPFRPLSQPEPWERTDRPRRAAVSAFGFGGNNAHVVVEEYVPGAAQGTGVAATPPVDVAIVALSTRLPEDLTLEQALFEGRTGDRIETVDVDLKGLRFPPNDLKATLAQQLMILQATREATDGLELPRDRTSVLVGTQCDPEVARYGARWRLKDWFPDANPEWVAEARNGVIPVLTSAGVLGTMPNIPANRINSQLDLAGPSLTFAAEELSGNAALDVALRALRHGELDAAVVGAADACCEIVQAHASAILPADRQRPGDAAVVMVLERLEDARAKGHPILGVIPGDPQVVGPAIGLSEGLPSLTPMLGHAHAASGLLHVAAAAVCLQHGKAPGGAPWPEGEPATVVVDTFSGQRHQITIAPGDGSTPRPQRTLERPLSLSAHPDPVRIPAPPQRTGSTRSSPPTQAPGARAGAARQTRETPMQHMAPAPALPPTTDQRPHDPSTMTVRVDRTSHPRPPAVKRPAASTPQRHTASTTGTLSAAPRTSPPPQWTPPADPNDPVAHVAALQSRLTQIHLDFLARNAEIHKRFLDVALRGPAAPPEKGRGKVLTPEARAELPDIDRVSTWPAASPTSPPRVSAPASPPPTPVTAKAPVSLRPTPAPVIAKAPPASAPPTPTPSTASPKASEPVPDTNGAPTPTGPTLDREQLKIHASGKISEIYGPLFEPQDGFVRQCRMPEPPLLLADRVTGIEGEAGSMGQGTIWTETDISHDSWYLNQGRIPAGIMIESGQADLMLISWLGIDLQHDGDRVYRLLGCDLTYRKGLPAAGDTMSYDIHVDGHAKHGDVRLFFFHYDCRVDGDVRLSVRNGQAGFFTDEELAESAGILWTPETGEHDDAARLDPPRLPLHHTSFSRGQIDAFAKGDGFACFGPGQVNEGPRNPICWELLQTHNRPPAIQSGRMTFLHEVTDFDPNGGPWKRGYLRAVQKISPDDWFFEGHFKNDPCMPGTLMFEGSLQAMAFYLAALGYTVDKDGWRFEPVPDHTVPLRCRGQVTPESSELVYEIFVEEVHDGPVPMLYADILCTGDGLKAFHARRMGLQLVPDWPITSRPEILRDYVESDGKPAQRARSEEGQAPGARAGGSDEERVGRLARSGGTRAAIVEQPDGSTFKLDYASLVACAWGKPSDAFGEMYKPFDGTRRPARLPGAPYHFMSRVTRADGEIGLVKPGAVIELEYDVPPEAWYFHENGNPTMPFCVFLEAALQPCGWLASYVGSALTTDEDLLFRNLDGTATWIHEVPPDAGTLTTRVKITNISQSGGMIIESFEVQCFVKPAERARSETDGGPRSGNAVRTEELATESEPRARRSSGGTGVKPAERARSETDGGPRSGNAVRTEELATESEPRARRSSGGTGVKPAERARSETDGGPRSGNAVRTEELATESEPRARRSSGGTGVKPAERARSETDGGPRSGNAVRTEELATESEPRARRSSGGTGVKPAERARSETDGGPRSGNAVRTEELATESEPRARRSSGGTGDSLKVYEMNTVFGFFPKEAFVNQVGIVPTEEDRAALAAPSDFHLDLTERPARYCEGSLRLPKPMLLMVDRITGLWADGGAHGKGRLRGEKTVNPEEWFFKAHFFQDPVQPGSLGLEALLQLLQFWMIEQGYAENMEEPRFEPLAMDVPLTWKYRGQVTPKNQTIFSEMDIVDVIEDEHGVTVIAEGYLWVDELRIYQAKNMGMRIVDGGRASLGEEEILDPAEDTWLNDHCPTFTVPALPMMSMVDRLIGAAERVRPGEQIAGVRDVQVHRWLPVSGPTRLTTEATGTDHGLEVTLLAWREARTKELSRFEPVCSGRVVFGEPQVMDPIAPLQGGEPVENPYETGTLFHGPAFHYLTSLTWGANGGNATLDAGSGSVPFGSRHQGLLDAMTHAIPHDSLHRFDPAIGEDQVAYPYRIRALHLHRAVPDAGELSCEVRYLRLDDGRFPVFRVALSDDLGCIVSMELTEVLLPKGPLGSADSEARRRFLLDQAFVEGLSLSEADGERTVLDPSWIKASNWLPGTIEATYGTTDPEVLVQKEHLGRLHGSHPKFVRITDDGGFPGTLPLTRFPVTVEPEGSKVVATSGPGVQDIRRIRARWADYYQLGPWPVEDLYYGLIERFIGKVHVEDPAGLEAIQNRSVLYLANHQVMLESLLLSIIVGGLTGVPAVTLAKIEHQTSWLGRLIAHCFAYPGCVDPEVITFFDRDDRRSLPRIIAQLKQDMIEKGKSVAVHVEGTRNVECRTPVQVMSNAFTDMGVKTGSPIVPVRFTRALPTEAVEERLDFPVGYGRQDIWLGAPIWPDEIDALYYKDRKPFVLDRLNGLGPSNAHEVPTDPDPAFEAEVNAWMEKTGVDAAHATLWCTLRAVDNPCEDTRILLDAAKTGTLDVPKDERGTWLRELAQRFGLE